MKKFISLFLPGIAAFAVHAQSTDSLRVKPSRVYNQATGLTGYYFWKEDSTGNIAVNSLAKPYFQNRTVLLRNDTQLPAKTTDDELRNAVNTFTHDPKWDPANRYGLYRLFHRELRKIIRSLGQQPSEKPSSVVYRKCNGEWTSERQRSVLYFTLDASYNRRFSHSSDSLIVPVLQTAIPANGLYEVVTYLNSSGTADSAKVYGYNGAEFTDSLRKRSVVRPVTFLLLVNGYRGPKKDDDPGDGLVTQKDRYYYWYKIDNRFQEVLKPDLMLFLDGSFPISTSNHRTKIRFAKSWVRARLTPKNRTSPRVYKRLNTTPNPEGFRYRREQGKIAGEAFLLARSLPPLADSVRDTLDIVCHSMGYAYTLGFLDVVEDRLVLRNMYIMAPENSGEGGFDWQQFNEVWQYGCNNDPQNPDPLRLQDGIAPQCAVKGLDQLPPDRGGRVFFPPDWPDRNFIDSHMVYSYDWMFDCIPEGDPGYIKP